MISRRTLMHIATAAAFATIRSAIAQDAGTIFNENKPAVVLVDVQATTSTGSVIPIHQGTGFIVSPNGHVITARHLLEPDAVAGRPSVQVDSYQIKGSVGSKYQPMLPMEILDQAQNSDLLLLKLPEPDASHLWPTVQICRSSALRIGDTLIHVGFPLSLDVGVVNGVLSSKNGPGGLWQTNLALNYGNSGGPVFENHGFVVGIVSGGLGGGVQGINYFRSIQYASALLAEALEQDQCKPDTLVADVQRTKPVLVTQTASFSFGPFGGQAQTTRPQTGTPVALDENKVVWLSQKAAGLKKTPQATKDVEYPLSFELTEHSFGVTSRNLSQSFAADSGYKIVQADVVPLSRNNASAATVQIASDGSSVTVGATLSSGPAFDQWRGWLNGVVKVKEVPL